MLTTIYLPKKVNFKKMVRLKVHCNLNCSCGVSLRSVHSRKILNVSILPINLTCLNIASSFKFSSSGSLVMEKMKVHLQPFQLCRLRRLITLSNAIFHIDPLIILAKCLPGGVCFIGER